jgi:hypothetical protein
LISKKHENWKRCELSYVMPPQNSWLTIGRTIRLKSTPTDIRTAEHSDIIASLQQSVADQLNPNRFVVRYIVRGKRAKG